MFPDSHAPSFDRAELQHLLASWAMHLTSDAHEQQLLVDKTILVAAGNPFMLEGNDVHEEVRALMRSLFLDGTRG